LNLSLTKLSIHLLFKHLCTLELSSRANTRIPVLVTSETRLHWSTLLKDFDRVKSTLGKDITNATALVDKENTCDLLNTDNDRKRRFLPEKGDQLQEVKRRIEALVIKHQGSLRQSGLSHMSSTLSKASHLKLDQIKACHALEKSELTRLL